MSRLPSAFREEPVAGESVHGGVGATEHDLAIRLQGEGANRAIGIRVKEAAHRAIEMKTGDVVGVTPPMLVKKLPARTLPSGDNAIARIFSLALGLKAAPSGPLKFNRAKSLRATPLW
jgi:hypothetical protein